jgi:hypothetical protein
MSESISYIGATVALAASTPATVDKAGYEALTWTTGTIGKIASFGALGETSADIAIDLLEGVIEHVNGSKDLGEIPVTIRFVATSDSAAQGLVRTNANSNTNHSFRVIDPDGEYIYFQGKLANYQDSERTSGNYKGASFVIRGKGGSLVRTVAPT